MKGSWDLVVLGGGTAGIVGAKVAANFGARVLLIEAERTGGDCLWTGCVPSKSLLAAAHVAAVGRSSGHYGVQYAEPSVDFAAVMSHVNAAITHIAPIDSPEALNEAGVEVLHGQAVLTGPQTVRVTEQDSTPSVPVVHDLEFNQLLLATGARPAVPPIPGLAQAQPYTSNSVWGMRELPGRLAILGGGSIGSELSQAFARLGATVTLVEGERRLIPREDERASRILTSALQTDGVTVRTGAKVTAVNTAAAGATDDDGDDDGDGGSKPGSLTLDDGSTVEFDQLLVAVGRSPRTNGIGLEEAGVEVSEAGMVVVDDLLRTTNPRIWAAGDLTGHPQFTHLAGIHGSTAATNAVLGTRRKAASTIPRVTFTDPEIAAVGVSTQDLDPGHQRVIIDHAQIDRAVAEGRTEGYTAIAFDKGGTILGATIVGPRAGESLGELTLAVTKGLKTRDLAGVMHPYPTYNDGPWKAALDDVSERLSGPVLGRATDVLAAARKRYLHLRR